MTHAMKIRKGDTVHMLAGKDRGKQGRVIDAQPRDAQGDRREPQHRQAPHAPASAPGLEPHGRPAGRAGRHHRQGRAPLPVSRVMLVCPVCKRPTRVGIETRETKGEGVRKVRICKRADCGQDIDR